MKYLGYLTTTLAMLLFSVAALLWVIAYSISNEWGRKKISFYYAKPKKSTADAPSTPTRDDLAPMNSSEIEID